MTSRSIRTALAVLTFAFTITSSAHADEITGAAILKHPIGALAMKAAELLKAGKVDDVIALRSRAEQADWKKTPADARRQLSEMMLERAPDPTAFAAAIRKNGVLTVNEGNANLRADMSGGATAIAFYTLEDGKWRAVTGPMVVSGGVADETKETRLTGADILKHPIAELAVRYVELIHAGKSEEAMRMASTSAQAEWKTLPASEKKESMAYRKKILPSRTEIKSAIESGGMLIIEDESGRATLNVVTTEQTSSGEGQVTSSSSTVAIPFILEDGKWKIAQ